jgi:hypothetical protein
MGRQRVPVDRKSVRSSQAPRGLGLSILAAALVVLILATGFVLVRPRAPLVGATSPSPVTLTPVAPNGYIASGPGVTPALTIEATGSAVAPTQPSQCGSLPTQLLSSWCQQLTPLAVSGDAFGLTGTDLGINPPTWTYFSLELLRAPASFCNDPLILYWWTIAGRQGAAQAPVECQKFIKDAIASHVYRVGDPQTGDIVDLDLP